MNKLNKFISEAEKIKIEQAVARAEEQTSGEIVPAIVEASDSYQGFGFRAALMGWAAASVATYLLHVWHPFAELEFWVIYAFQVFGLVLGWALCRLPFTFRFFVPKSVREQEVLEAAQSAFMRFGLVNTKDRTGVLVFVSLKEHIIRILADRGIHEKVGEEFWKSETDRIALAIRNGKPAEGMVEAILSIGQKLHIHFPRKVGDTNELPNTLRS